MSPRNRHCHLANFYELFIGLQRALNLALKMAVSGYTSLLSIMLVAMETETNKNLF
jgi:hypothetical protein